MIIGNRSDTPRALLIGQSFINLPPMGYATLPDDAATKDAVKKLMETSTIKQLVDLHVLCFEVPNAMHAPTHIDGPKPPKELTSEPSHARVTTERAKLTTETVKV